ncbi:unnamed protein product [Rotaria sordida]|uniref:Protein kinase domain-containing protein n=1 Tax=Rotaria sordida TaxID=392033 RepID=A0A814GY09_9BILA|nr:unnamed protein product [Rotaria sordida]CAF3627927.1 unnamed protein product [Rotaria sordida]
MEHHVANKNHQNTHPLVVASNQDLIKIDVLDICKGRVLGQGAFRQVYKATWLSKKRLVACKVITVTPQRSHLEDSFRKELAAYAELSGAYILKILGYGEHMIGSGIKECYLITEFMHHGSLANVINDRNEKISLRRKLSMACHIVSGMQKLHAHCMIHRDIRPDNILVSSNYTAKIGDMGIAHVFNPAEKHTLMGCLPFMPPEFHRGSSQYDQSLDVFTYGLTLNELFTEKAHQFNKSTKRVKLTEQSPIFADLITQCINDESIRRPTAAELQDILYRFRRTSDNYIQEKHLNYANQTLTAKNSIFVKCYNQYQKQESVLEPKPVHLPPPKPHMDSDLTRQYFDDMMKQFNRVHRPDFHQEKDRQRSPHLIKWMKYFDDEWINDLSPKFNADIMKIDRRPRRSSSPPSNFLQVQNEGHQQFLNVVKHKRSRTPTPLSPAFGDLEHRQNSSSFANSFRLVSMNDDIEQHVGEFHFDVGFDQHAARVKRMMDKLK